MVNNIFLKVMPFVK